MLPQALMLAATWITVPEEGTGDAAGDDAVGAGEEASAEDIGDEEALTEAEAGTAADGDEEGAAPAEVAVAGELLAEGAVVLDEPQALSPTARTTAAEGRKMDRRNITELSNFEVRQDTKQRPGQGRQRRDGGCRPCSEANLLLIVVVNIIIRL